jgi:hypothetical protein
MGSPREVGSTKSSKVSNKLLSLAVKRLRPPPGRLIRRLPSVTRDFSESINVENKRDEEGIESLHPPMYHIVRLERQLTQAEDANVTQSSFPQGIH